MSGHSKVISSLIVLNDTNRTVVSGALDQTFRCWNLKDRSCLADQSNQKENVLCFEYFTKLKYLLTGGQSSNINVWKVKLDKERRFKALYLKLTISNAH